MTVSSPPPDGGVPEPLAIVGIGCRFPGGVATPAGFWQLLCDGRDAITPAPPDPARAAALAHDDAYAHGGFLDAVDGFDWRAFRTSPREARFMDPQQRLVLEVAWEAFEHAGMTFESLAGARATVAVGIMWPDYAKLQAQDPARIDGYSVTGSGFAYAANRVSAFFGLTGPSFALDAMCVSSLVGVHLACQSIWSGESELALAAGVNLILSPDTNIAMTKARILSPDGRCKTFDERANGFVRGEGAGAVVIKRASQAARDGDRVIALIRGSALNHCGRSEWIMAPSRDAQAAVVTEACRRAGVHPGALDYVELHGTGTAKGDPIEAAALGDTVGRARPDGRSCRVGSVKTNIGHLDSAAGMAGLVKTALAVYHAKIPASLHFRSANPAIALAELGLEVQTELGDWPQGDGPRLAGVTGLSFGGTNAHVVLEGPPAVPRDERPPRAVILPVSAETGEGLVELLGDHAALLRGAAAPPIEDLAYTAAARRTHRPARAAVVGSSAGELAGRLERAALAGRDRAKLGATGAPAPVFVFSGQGCSWRGMGRSLARDEPEFRSALEECDAAVRAAGGSLLAAIEDADPRLAADGDPASVQPALCAIEIALTRLWRSWGITPGAVVGHSVGEIAAAHAAGVLSTGDAMRIAVARGAIMARLHGRGRTAQLALGEQETVELLAPLGAAVWIAGVNGPRATVVAGDPAVVERVVTDLRAREIAAVVLPVHSAFHGGAIGPLADELAEHLAEIVVNGQTTPMISTVDAEPIVDDQLGAGYWRRQMTVPVRFLAAIRRLVADGHRTFVEVAPHPVMRSAILATLREARIDGAAVASLRRDGDERADLLAAVAELYAIGHDVEWGKLQGEGRVVAVPPYRWQRERLWLDPPSAQPTMPPAGHPLLGRRIELAHDPSSWMWESEIDLRRLPYLAEHRIDGVAVLPGSAYVEIAATAVRQAYGWGRCELEDVRFERAMTLQPECAVRVQTLLSGGEGARTVVVRSAAADGWARHFTARMVQLGGEPPALTPLMALEERGPLVDDCYAQFARHGVEYGPFFRAITRAWIDGGAVQAELEAPAAVQATMGQYQHHPALLDACMHVVALASGAGSAGFMPTDIAMLRLHEDGVARVTCEVTVVRREADAIVADLVVRDDGGRVVLEGRGLRLRALAPTAEPSSCHRVVWHEVETDRAAERPIGSSWVVLADGGGVGELVARGLRARGAQVDVVFADDDPAAARLAVERDGVVHLWSLDVAPGLPSEPRELARAARLAATSVVDLVRGLRDTPLWLVTRGAQAIGGDDLMAPLRAIAWGIGRTLRQELPSMWGGLVDLDPVAAPAPNAERLLRCIEQHAAHGQLAVRGERILAAQLIEHAVRPADAELPALAPDGAYLVTGGLGGLGGATARWLVERGARHVVLVGRSPLPPRTAWDDPGAVAAHGPRIARVRDLERRGASVSLVAGDVGDATALAAALGTLRRNGLPPIHGVVHAAGVSRFDSLDQMTESSLASVLSAKVDGSVALHHALAGEPLDFFVLYSSIAALFSSPRLGHYAAANAFQGALAAHRRSLGQPAQALYWGVWEEVGMGTHTADGPRTLRGHRPMSTARGLELLAQALQDGAPELALFDMDWAQWREAYSRAASDPLLARLVATGAPAPPASAVAVRATSPGIAPRIALAVADVLRLRGVTDAEALADLGFDSLIAVELRVRIEEDIGVRVPMLRLLQAATVADLVTCVTETVEAGTPD